MADPMTDLLAAAAENLMALTDVDVFIRSTNYPMQSSRPDINIAPRTIDAFRRLLKAWRTDPSDDVYLNMILTVFDFTASQIAPSSAWTEFGPELAELSNDLYEVIRESPNFEIFFCRLLATICIASEKTSHIWRMMSCHILRTFITHEFEDLFELRNALGTFSTALNFIDKNELLEFYRKNIQLLRDFSKLVLTCGNFVMQSEIIKIVFFYVSEERTSARGFFDSSYETEQLFQTLDIYDSLNYFRDFINHLNTSVTGSDRKVLSLACDQFLVGEMQLEAPCETNAIWFDLNLGTNELSLTCADWSTGLTPNSNLAINPTVSLAKVRDATVEFGTTSGGECYCFRIRLKESEVLETGDEIDFMTCTVPLSMNHEGNIADFNEAMMSLKAKIQHLPPPARVEKCSEASIIVHRTALRAIEVSPFHLNRQIVSPQSELTEAKCPNRKQKRFVESESLIIKRCKKIQDCEITSTHNSGKAIGQSNFAEGTKDKENQPHLEEVQKEEIGNKKERILGKETRTSKKEKPFLKPLGKGIQKSTMPPITIERDNLVPTYEIEQPAQTDENNQSILPSDSEVVMEDTDPNIKQKEAIVALGGESCVQTNKPTEKNVESMELTEKNTDPELGNANTPSCKKEMKKFQYKKMYTPQLSHVAEESLNETKTAFLERTRPSSSNNLSAPTPGLNGNNNVNEIENVDTENGKTKNDDHLLDQVLRTVYETHVLSDVDQDKQIEDFKIINEKSALVQLTKAPEKRRKLFCAQDFSPLPLSSSSNNVEADLPIMRPVARSMQDNISNRKKENEDRTFTVPITRRTKFWANKVRELDKSLSKVNEDIPKCSLLKPDGRSLINGKNPSTSQQSRLWLRKCEDLEALDETNEEIPNSSDIYEFSEAPIDRESVKKSLKTIKNRRSNRKMKLAVVLNVQRRTLPKRKVKCKVNYKEVRSEEEDGNKNAEEDKEISRSPNCLSNVIPERQLRREKSKKVTVKLGGNFEGKVLKDVPQTRSKKADIKETGIIENGSKSKDVRVLTHLSLNSMIDVTLPYIKITKLDGNRLQVVQTSEETNLTDCDDSNNNVVSSKYEPHQSVNVNSNSERVKHVNSLSKGIRSTPDFDQRQLEKDITYQCKSTQTSPRKDSKELQKADLKDMKIMQLKLLKKVSENDSKELQKVQADLKDMKIMQLKLLKKVSKIEKNL